MFQNIPKYSGKFIVAIWEYERGMGSNVDSLEPYDTEKQANDRIAEFNAGNTKERVPDWYMVAKAYNY